MRIEIPPVGIDEPMKRNDIWLQRCRDFLFTKPCLGCGALLDVFSSGLFCKECLKTVERTGYLFENFYGAGLLSVYAYSGAIRRAVHAFKFRGDERCGAYLAEELRKLLESHAFDLIVYVPCFRLKGGRKYNSAEWIARRLSRTLGIPVGEGVLRKTRDAASQTRQKSRAARFRNVSGLYRVHRDKKSLVSGKKVLLVDDISTTGATLSVCIGALSDAGAAGICAAVIARTEKGARNYKRLVYPNLRYHVKEVL